MNFFKIFTVAVCFLVLAACTSGSAIIIGDARPPISVLDVKLYLEPPAEYKTVGLVEASSEVALSSQEAQNRAIREMKRQAARIGANGVLLLNSGDKLGDASSYVSGGRIYTSRAEYKVVKGKAILVK